MAGKIPAKKRVVNTVGVHKPTTSNEILYVNKTVNDDGWLKTHLSSNDLSDSRISVYLCKYTKLQSIQLKQGRRYFKVLDGANRGKIVSLSNANASLYLGKQSPNHVGVEVVVTYGKYEEKWYSKAKDVSLNQQWATLTVGGIQATVVMNSLWNNTAYPLPAGEYTILLPDSPHDKNMTEFYRKVEPSLRFDQVWFPIKYTDNTRYIHVGNVSHGCVTVVDLARWAGIHEALISHRSPDSRSIGKLIVKGKPEKEK
jgi:hypothetical protein